MCASLTTTSPITDPYQIWRSVFRRYVRRGTYATVLMDLIEELAGHQELVSRGQILGHAVAHEIGHLIMGLNSHSSHGLMRSGWKAKELHDMAERHLLFSKQEGERMRIRIRSTDELETCAYGPPALSLASPRVAGASSERYPLLSTSSCASGTRSSCLVPLARSTS